MRYLAFRNMGLKLTSLAVAAIAGLCLVAGTVSADKTLQLTAQMPGRIATIAGQEGDAFDKGTVLVELDDSALRARREAALHLVTP